MPNFSIRRKQTKNNDDSVFYHIKSTRHRLDDKTKHDKCHICGLIENCPNTIINDECEVLRYIVYFKNVPVGVLQKTVKNEIPCGKTYKIRQDGAYIDVKALAISVCEKCFMELKNAYNMEFMSVSPGHTH